MSDAPRRRRLDPLRVLVGLVALVVVVLVGFVVSDEPDLEAAMAPVASSNAPLDGASALEGARAGTTIVEPEALLERLEQKPATTSKGKLLKSELKKKAERDVAKKSVKLAAAPAGTTEVLLSGDDELRRALRGKLTGVRLDVDGTRGFQLSLRSQSGSQGDTVFVKCSAAVSELPARKLVASLSSRADVGGDGMNDDELKDAAMSACATSLADDVSKWVRAHR